MRLFLIFTLAAFQAVVARGDPTDEPRPVFFLVDRSGSVSGPLAELPEAGHLGTLRHVWAWLPSSLPVKISGEQVRKGGPELVHSELRKIRPRPLRVQLRNATGPAAASETKLLAAPVEMWQEIEESKIPFWTFSRDGVVTIPTDSRQAWRIRAVGPARASWWSTVRAAESNAIVQVTPAQPIDITIRGHEGKVLSHAVIALMESLEGRSSAVILANVRADEKGVVRVARLPNEQKLSLVINAADHTPKTLTAYPEEWPEDIQLEPGTRIKGRFIDDEKRAISDVEVSLETWLSQDAAAIFRIEGKSGENGIWSLDKVPSSTVVFVASKRGLATIRREIKVDLAEIDLGSITMVPGLSIPLVVLDDEGKGIPKADVKAGQQRWTTGAKGETRIESLSPDEPVELIVDAKGFLAFTQVFSPPFPKRVEIRLQPAFTVTGRLLGPSGVPPDSGAVRVEQGSSSRIEALSSGGEFKIELMPATTSLLILSAKSLMELRLSVKEGTAGETRDLGDLQGETGLIATGRVVERSTGLRVANARIWTPQVVMGGPLVAWTRGEISETRSLPDGSFELKGLSPGVLLLRVDAANYARAFVTLSPEPAAGPTDVGVISLEEGATVRVSTDKELETLVARADLRGESTEIDVLTTSVRDGTATFNHVPAGRVRVSIVDKNATRCEKEIEIPAGKISVEAECRSRSLLVRGEVRMGESPSGAGMLVWSAGSAAPPEGVITTRVSAGGARQQQVYGAGSQTVLVDVDEFGQFTTKDLRPGAWKAVWSARSGGATEPRSVEIPDAETFSVILHYRDSMIRGIVKNAQGAPVSRARVMELSTGAVALCDADGFFSLRGLAPGERRMQATRENLASAIKLVQVHPAEQTPLVELILREKPASELQVLVQGAGGEPGSGAFVMVDTDTQGMLLLTADSNGKVKAEFPRGVPATVRLAAYYHARWVLGPWQGWPADGKPQSLVVKETGALLLKSEKIAGGPVLIGPGGWDVAWLLTRLGMRPWVSPSVPLSVTGLPEGTYRISLNQLQTSVEIRRDQTKEATLK